MKPVATGFPTLRSISNAKWASKQDNNAERFWPGVTFLHQTGVGVGIARPIAQISVSLQASRLNWRLRTLQRLVGALRGRIEAEPFGQRTFGGRWAARTQRTFPQPSGRLRPPHSAHPLANSMSRAEITPWASQPKRNGFNPIGPEIGHRELRSARDIFRAESRIGSAIGRLITANYLKLTRGSKLLKIEQTR